jgi:hypothetical protein
MFLIDTVTLSELRRRERDPMVVVVRPAAND